MNASSASTLKKREKELASLEAELNQPYREDEVVQVEVPALSVDVAALRAKLGLTQQAFADRFDLGLKSIRSWEQGSRTPERGALLYLTLIESNPEFVLESLAAKKRSAVT